MRPRLILAVMAVLLLVLIIAGWIEIEHGFSARDLPTALEAIVARKVRMMAIPPEAKNEKNPYVPSPDTLTEARRHFADHCAICHGNDGRGNTTMAEISTPKPRICALRGPKR